MAALPGSIELPIGDVAGSDSIALRKKKSTNANVSGSN